MQDLIGECPALADKASGIFNAAYSLGCIIAPIIGAALNQEVKFARTCDVMAMCAMGYASVYCVVGIILPKVIGEKPTLIDINATRHKNNQQKTPDTLGQAASHSSHQSRSLDLGDEKSILVQLIDSDKALKEETAKNTFLNNSQMRMRLPPRNHRSVALWSNKRRSYMQNHKDQEHHENPDDITL